MGRRIAANARQFVNLDADEGVFFLRQLEQIKSKSYDVEYPELKAREFIPVSYEAGPGAKFITYRQYDMLGVAKIISNYASDLPRVDLKGKEFVGNVRSIGDSYGYSLQDVRSAKMAGLPLEQRKANAAKRAALQLEDTIALTGDTTHNLGGFLSNPNITDNAAPNNAGATSTLWSHKTATEILADLISLSETSVDASLGVEESDTILLPLSQYNLIANLQMPNINMTVLKFFLENSPYIKTIDRWNRLAGAGSGGTDVAVCYRKDPDKLTLEVPQDFEQLPVQEKGLEYEVPCHMRCGGVIIYYPLSIALMHHI
jgi:hypothetical protein